MSDRSSFFARLRRETSNFSAKTQARISKLLERIDVNGALKDPEQFDAWILALPHRKPPLFRIQTGPLLLPWEGCQDAEFYRWCVVNSLQTWSTMVFRFLGETPDLFAQPLCEIPFYGAFWDEANHLYEIRRAGFRTALARLRAESPRVASLADLRAWCDQKHFELRLVSAAFPSRPCGERLLDFLQESAHNQDERLCVAVIRDCLEKRTEEIDYADFGRETMKLAWVLMKQLSDNLPAEPTIPAKSPSFSELQGVFHNALEIVRHWSYEPEQPTPLEPAVPTRKKRRKKRVTPTASPGDFSDPISFGNDREIAAIIECVESTARRQRRNGTLPFYYEGKMIVVSKRRLESLKKSPL